MGILVPVESAGTRGDREGVHRAEKSNWGRREKEVTFYTAAILQFKIVADFFSMLDSLSLLCKQSDVSKERRTYRPLYTNLLSPKSPTFHAVDVGSCLAL